MKLTNPFTTTPGSAVTFVGGAHTASDNTFAATVSVTYTPTAGNWVFIAYMQENNISGVSCADNNGHNIPLVTFAAVRGNTDGMGAFLAQATAGATSFTVTWTTSAHPCCAIAEYSPSTGLSIGSNTTATGTATSFSNSQSTTGGNNKILSAVGLFVTGNPSAATISTGTKREDSGAATAFNEIILTDNTNSSGVTVAGTQTGGSNLAWGIISVELIASSTTVPSSANQVGGN